MRDRGNAAGETPAPTRSSTSMPVKMMTWPMHRTGNEGAHERSTATPKVARQPRRAASTITAAPATVASSRASGQ